MINIFCRTVSDDEAILSIPLRYRHFIGRYCVRVGMEPSSYWLSNVEPQLWLQLPGVVVTEVL